MKEEINMPIGKTEFQSGKRFNEVEDSVTSFLKERKEDAFTSQEIMAGVGFHTDFSTLEKTRISTYAVSDFTNILYEMVRKGKVATKLVEGQMYFAAGTDVAKCPKCGDEIAEPKKTWKMAGRPDKKGQRMQLHIGLYECPKHGNFRVTLGKQKI
jgi:hypothetical protein